MAEDIKVGEDDGGNDKMAKKSALSKKLSRSMGYLIFLHSDVDSALFAKKMSFPW